jgi:hydroxyacylglutathione hydrolase
MTQAHLPLEDTFGDILRKAMRGRGVSESRLAQATGIDPHDIRAWLKDEGSAGEDQAYAIARVLRLDPHSLADSAANRWYPPAIETPDVRRHPQLPHPSNGYVFFLETGSHGSEPARQAALVDPAGVPENLLRLLREGAYQLQYILITHKHRDHCDATAEGVATFPQAQIVMHKLDVHAIGPLANQALLLRDGEDLPFGESARIRMLHTPGHTDGSSSYLFQNSGEPTLFSGDTLFAASVGGAYGDLSTYGDILNSITSKLFALDDETVVMPGHGPPTRIGLEKHHNPFFPDRGGDH